MTDCHQENSQWSIKLLQTLNTVAIALQTSGRTVDDIFHIFKEQLAAVNMGGAIILLDDPARADEPDATATVFANTISNATIRKLEERLNLSASNLTFKLSQATVMQKIIRTGEPQFVADSQPLLAQYLPPKAQPYAKLITRPFKNIPSIDAPIYQKERIIGILAFTTPGLTPTDIPAIEAFAHHIGIALENTNLIQSLHAEIARHKNTEQQLAASEQRYRTLIESAPVAIIIHCDEKFVYLNPTAIRILGGKSEADFVGKSLYDVIDPTQHEATRKRMVILYERSEPVLHARNVLIRLDGTPITVELVSSPIIHQQKPAGLVILQDITASIASDAKLEERLSQLTLLNDVSREIAATLKLSDLFERTVSLIHDKFGYHHVAIFTRNEAEQSMMMVAGAGALAALFPKNHHLKFSEGMVGWATRHKKTLVANDISKEPVHHNPLPEHPQMVTRAELTIPIIVGGIVEAVLDIQSPNINAFGKHQVMVMETLTQQIAVAIENARHLETIEQDLAERRRTEITLRRRNQELSLLNQVIAVSASSSNLLQALKTISYELATTIHADWCGVVTVDRAETSGVLVASQRTDAVPTAIPMGTTLPLPQTFVDFLKQTSAIPITDISKSDIFSDILPDIDTSELHVSALLIPITDGTHLLGVLGIGTRQPREYSDSDATLAHRVADQLAGVIARMELERTRQQLSMAMEQASEAVAITTPEGRIIYLNAAFERLFGYSQTEVLNTIPTSLAPENALEHIDEALRNGTYWQGQMDFFRKDGSTFVADVSIMPIQDEQQQAVNFVMTVQDVTQQVELEERLRQSQKMEAVGQLAAGIAHDFNNMLTAINGFSELLLEKIPFGTPQHEYVLQILESGNRAADLVRQLLAFSRKQLIAPKILNINQKILDMQQMLRRVIGEHITIQTKLSPDVYPIKMDPAQVEQILVNLAVNAQDAMADGGTLCLETANVLLSSSFTDRLPDVPPGEYVMLTVSDTGMGIPDDVVEHIFEPFFTTKDVGKGTGLGLATIYGIVKQNQGHIEVHSEHGVGTTFFVYLPRTHEVAHAPPMKDTQKLPVGAATIMVVEDSEFVLDFTQTVLSELGYTVMSALSAQEALDRFRNLDTPPDLLVTDVVLPGMNGKKLAITTRQLFPKVKILFISGYKEAELEYKLLLDNGAAFLSKPFTATDLAQTIHSLLSKN